MNPTIYCPWCGRQNVMQPNGEPFEAATGEIIRIGSLTCQCGQRLAGVFNSRGEMEDLYSMRKPT